MQQFPRMTTLACIAAFALARPSTRALAPPAPQPQKVAQSVWLIPGSFPAQREPDGNTIIFAAPGGLIVMDTGRHTWHTQAILDFARTRKQPILAIINSHWHLDHTSGNAAIKHAFPQARVYASNAIDAAITDFFPKSAAGDKAYLDSGQASAEITGDLKDDLAIMASPETLKPDVPVFAANTETIAGLPLELHLAPNAATDADVWVYSPASRLAAIGDLVTLPVPFLDTACVSGWENALDAVSATPFLTAIPGHGSPMTQAQFATYRTAFSAFAACAKSSAPSVDCATHWMESTAALRAPEPAADPRTRAMANDYIELLRAHGGNSAYCKAP